jgi:hypothetical protein
MKPWSHFSGSIAEEWTDVSRKARRFGAAAAVLAAALPVALFWGFTVDDALIPARIAAHLWAGIGYRFNPGGPVVDAVTPLGWAHLLAPFARSGPLGALAAAQWLGVLSWLAAAAVLGASIARSGQRLSRFAPISVIVVCSPLAAWAVAGLETGMVTALATLAVTQQRFSPLAAGIAAALRPELLPWAAVVCFGTAAAERKGPRGIAAASLMAVAPAILVGAIRFAVFGRAWPLAVLAKPSDLDHGAFYALSALLQTGPAWLVLAPRALRKAGWRAIAIVVAAAVHFAALTLAGGDWMPFYRLAVPVLPGLLLVGAMVAEHAAPWATALRIALAVAACLAVAAPRVADARRVGSRRLAVIEAARPALGGARCVAAQDIGWVGAATAVPIVDLAGLTDPQIAALSGGHTTKRIPPGLLEGRGVDALVLLIDQAWPPPLPWYDAPFTTGVQHRVALLMAGYPFAPAASIPLGGTRSSYIILRLKSEGTSH